MKHKTNFLRLQLLLMGVFLVFASSCEKDDDNGDTVINISAILGVTPPDAPETPVTEIDDTEQYTGTVSWSPADASFEYETEYTATITLTAKSGYTLTGVTTDFFTVAGANSVSNNADKGMVTAVFPATAAYTIGDTGPAGGWIFYDKGSYSDGWRYLEAGPKSTEGEQKQWGDKGTLIGPALGTADVPQLTGIGDGKANTDAIVSHMVGKSITGTAAQFCDDLSHGGYEDWFLPSKEELNQMYTNLHDHGVGGFKSFYYWSSSEAGASYAWEQDFYNGNQNLLSYDKSERKYVRPIRAF